MAKGGIFLGHGAIDAAYGEHRTAYHSGSLGSLGMSLPETRRRRIDRPRIDLQQTAYHSGSLGQDLLLKLKRHSYQEMLHGLGDLTMDPKTVAALQSCSTSCESQYGVMSGHPDVINLVACFGACNAKYPPTVTMPAVLPSTLPGTATLPPSTQLRIPGLSFPSLLQQPAPQPSPYEPLVPPPPAAQSSNLKWYLIGGGVLVAAAVGVYAYKKSSKG